MTRPNGNTDTEYTRTEDNRKQCTKCYRQSGKRHEHDENAEKNEETGAGHTTSISGHYNHDKFAADSVQVCGEMRLHFGDRTRDDFFVHLGELTSNYDTRHLECL